MAEIIWFFICWGIAGFIIFILTYETKIKKYDKYLASLFMVTLGPIVWALVLYEYLRTKRVSNYYKTG